MAWLVAGAVRAGGRKKSSTRRSESDGRSHALDDASIGWVLLCDDEVEKKDGGQGELRASWVESGKSHSASALPDVAPVRVAVVFPFLLPVLLSALVLALVFQTLACRASSSPDTPSPPRAHRPRLHILFLFSVWFLLYCLCFLYLSISSLLSYGPDDIHYSPRPPGGNTELDRPLAGRPPVSLRSRKGTLRGRCLGAAERRWFRSRGGLGP